MAKTTHHGTSYRPLLLPETVEVAFAAIRASLERSFVARRLRRLTAPAIVKAGTSDSFCFTCPGREGRYTIPSDLTDWKLRKMTAYGIGSGYGIYTYIRTINPTLAPSPTDGPVGDRLECMRDIEPDEAATATMIASMRWLYGAIAEASKEVTRMFPHIPVKLPSEIQLAGEASDIPHECRVNQAVAALSEDGRESSLWLWSDTAGMPVKSASLTLIHDKYIAGWCSPGLVAMVLLRLASMEEIFPIE